MLRGRDFDQRDQADSQSVVIIGGIIVALTLVRFIESILYGVSDSDPITVVVAVFVPGLAASLACLLPALRATRINPITALRE